RVGDAGLHFVVLEPGAEEDLSFAVAVRQPLFLTSRGAPQIPRRARHDARARRQHDLARTPRPIVVAALLVGEVARRVAHRLYPIDRKEYRAARLALALLPDEEHRLPFHGRPLPERAQEIR